ncbi:MAG: TIGR03118 family protein, partial [Pseudomonadota bacterium]|nr:TIGR03118 family protein [Pseudomonadota bacterium]
MPFTDTSLPAGFVPFNVQDIAGKVYVTYAPAGLAAQRAAAPGAGFLSVFDENGGLLQRLVSGSRLAAPWGVALAPAGFGQFGGDLLVGNFSFAS